MGRKKTISVKQKKFADYFVELGNAEQAARKAGYSELYARAQSYKLLANVGIKSYIDERLAQLEEERIASAAEVMKYLTKVMRGESEAEIVVVEGSGDGCSNARHITKNPDEKEKLKAAELLGKRYRLFGGEVDVDKESEKKLDEILNALPQIMRDNDA